jgi:hypothetical protein
MTAQSTEALRLSSSLKLVQPAAAKALELAWQRQRRELAQWQPSGGWLLDVRNAQSRQSHR